MESVSVVALNKAFELAYQIGDAMHAALSERGLTPVRAEVLLILRQHGRAMVQRELSQELRCTPRHVTQLVDALEAHGWVLRGPHPTDRRATLVALTEQGEGAADWMSAQRCESAHALLDHLPAADLTGFIAVADHLLRHIGAEPKPDSTTITTGPAADAAG